MRVFPNAVSECSPPWQAGYIPEGIAPLCSSGSPEPERGRIGHSCPTEGMSARLIYRSAGACPPRTLDYANDGEGQALALR